MKVFIKYFIDNYKMYLVGLFFNLYNYYGYSPVW